MVLMGDTVRDIDSIRAAVERGDVTEERIDASVRRILTMKARVGLFGEDPDLELTDDILSEDQKYADAIFVLNDKLLEIQEKHQHPGRFFDRDFSRYGGTHSSSDGIFTESLAYALEMARLQKDQEREKVYREAIGLAVHNLLTLQSSHEPIRAKKGRPSVVGAFRVRENDGRIRIDSTQHIMDAYRKILEVW